MSIAGSEFSSKMMKQLKRRGEHSRILMLKIVRTVGKGAYQTALGRRGCRMLRSPDLHKWDMPDTRYICSLATQFVYNRVAQMRAFMGSRV